MIQLIRYKFFIILLALSLCTAFSAFPVGSAEVDPYIYNEDSVFLSFTQNVYSYPAIRFPSQTMANFSGFWPSSTVQSRLGAYYYFQPIGSALGFFSPATSLSNFISNGWSKYNMAIGYGQPFSYGMWNDHYGLSNWTNPGSLTFFETPEWKIIWNSHFNPNTSSEGSGEILHGPYF